MMMVANIKCFPLPVSEAGIVVNAVCVLIDLVFKIDLIFKQLCQIDYDLHFIFGESEALQN